MEKRPNKNPASDEIDLGQLFELLNRGFKKLGNFFLRVFVYLRKHFAILLGLVVLGIAISFLLNMFVPQKLTTEILVRPNFESEHYLEDVVAEIQSHIASGDTQYFEKLGIDLKDLKGYSIEVESTEESEEQTDKEAMQLEMQYLELLQNFKDQAIVQEILKSELSQKSVPKYRIRLTYKESKKSEVVANKIVAFLNENPYFTNIKNVYHDNAEARIKNNSKLIGQIDELLANYAKGQLTNGPNPGQGTLVVENENGLNVPGLLSLKGILGKDIEQQKVFIAEQTGAVTVINVSKNKLIKKPFFNKRIVALPFYLILAFLAFSAIKYLNRKSKELN